LRTERRIIIFTRMQTGAEKALAGKLHEAITVGMSAESPIGPLLPSHGMKDACS
jgi:hypothetical protein